MTFKMQQPPLFSQSEPDGCIGVRSYLRAFQDLSAQHFFSFGKGNDVVPGQYGICWILSKYRLQVLHRAPVGETLSLETWIPAEKSKIRLHPGLRIVDSRGEACALGQMELCLTHVAEGRIARLDEIDFPFAQCEDGPVEAPKVSKVRIDEEPLRHAFTHTVRYTDLDNNQHMNNLHYADLVLNAFPAAFHRDHPICGIEMEYVGQCLEGERIEALASAADGCAQVLARRETGEAVLKARLALG